MSGVGVNSLPLVNTLTCGPPPLESSVRVQTDVFSLGFYGLRVSISRT